MSFLQCLRLEYDMTLEGMAGGLTTPEREGQ